MMECTKGLSSSQHDLDIQVTIYNLGFYIIVRHNGSVNQTTRKSPLRVMEYIGAYLINHHIKHEELMWKPNQKVIQDKDGFFKTRTQ